MHVKFRLARIAGYAALALAAGSIVGSVPASAQHHGGHGGFGGHGRFGGHGGFGIHGRFGSHGGFGGHGLRHGFYGGHGGYGHHHGYRRYGHFGYGAAGLLGGFALGTLAARPAYGGYGYGYGYPASYGYDYPAYDRGDCHLVRRRFVGAYGGTYIRRVRVCD